MRKQVCIKLDIWGQSWKAKEEKLAYFAQTSHRLSALITSSVTIVNPYRGGSLTTSKKSTESSKLGFFLVSLMTEELRVWPPHSNWMLGDVTLDNWNFFMLRTPQHSTCHASALQCVREGIQIFLHTHTHTCILLSDGVSYTMCLCPAWAWHKLMHSVCICHT